MEETVPDVTVSEPGGKSSKLTVTKVRPRPLAARP